MDRSKDRREFLKTAGFVGGAGVAVRGMGAKEIKNLQGSLENSSEPALDWQKTYGSSADDIFTSVAEASDGYLAVGYTSPENEDYFDGWLFKTDKKGIKKWEKKFTKPDQDFFYDIISISDGYLIMGQRIFKGGEVYEPWLVKIDGKGNVMWDKTYDVDPAGAFDFGLEESDGYVLTGGFGSNKDPFDGIMAKVNKQGNIMWSKEYGESGRDSLYEFVSLSDGYLATGETATDSGQAGWLVKTNKKGKKQWEKTYGSSNNNDVFYSMDETSDGYILAGSYGFKKQNYQVTGGDGWLMEVNGQGKEMWQSKFGDSGHDEFLDVVSVSDGYIASGEKTPSNKNNPDGWILKSDNQGSQKGEKTYSSGGDNVDGLNWIMETSDNGYLCAGYQYPADTNVGDGWLVKLKGDGNGGGGGDEIDKAIANLESENDVVDFPELQKAISFWIQGTEVPGTDGKTIDFSKLQELINLWVQGTKV